MIKTKYPVIGSFFCVLLCLLLLSAVSPTVWAAYPVTCTVNYHLADGTALSGKSFRLYRVASVGDDLSCAPTKEFQKYAVDLDDPDSDGLKAAAETLSAYVARDHIVPLDQGVTDANGIVVFPKTVSTLENGLYMLLGDSVTVEGVNYTAEPVLLFLPYQDETDGLWVYDVTVAPKSAPRTDSDTLSVVKIWKEDSDSARPESIEVQLLKDGEIYDTVKLTKSNSWRHTWKDLPGGCDWQLTEKTVPDDYTVVVSREQTTFSVTNTLTSGGKNPGGSAGDSSGKLPQTGMVWWPIPILAALGLLLVLLGWLRHRRYEE